MIYHDLLTVSSLLQNFRWNLRTVESACPCESQMWQSRGTPGDLNGLWIDLQG
jgi:hypothetical protein